MTKYYTRHIWNEYSSIQNEASPIEKAVDAILKALDWEEETENTRHITELVVLISLDRSIWCLPLPDAHLFLNLLPNGRRVLFIGFDKNEQPTSVDTSWFFHLGILSTENQFPQLIDWLRDDDPIELINPNNPISFEIVKNKFAHLCREYKSLYDWAIIQKDLLHFYADLYQKANRFSYDMLEHDLYNKIKSAKLEGKNETIGKAYLKKVEIDEYFDLLEGLRYAAYYNEQIQNKKHTEENKCKLLLIDDHPEKYKEKIVIVLKAFGIEADVHTLKVNKGSPNADLCSNLSKYNSSRLTNEFKNESFQINTEEGDKSITAESFFKYHTILVDLLMPDDTGHQRVIGVNIIRALRRLATDLSNRDTVGFIFPDIIAFSLADDVLKIQEALRAGADAYVNKTRILSLPGTLGRLSANPHQPSIYARRNFRSLYQLPEETRRLLQTLVIPPVRFDRDPWQFSEKEEWNEKRVKAQPVAYILQRIPKPDIHVHIGSCMSPEFLVVASLVMLLRHSKDETVSAILDAYKDYAEFWNNKINYRFIDELCLEDTLDNPAQEFDYKRDRFGIKTLATEIKRYLEKQIVKVEEKTDSVRSLVNVEKIRPFRSILHKGLGLPGHWDIDRLKIAVNHLPDIDLFLFLMAYGGPSKKGKQGNNHDMKKDDIIRLFLLFQAANVSHNPTELKDYLCLNKKKVNYLDWFKYTTIGWRLDQWKALHKLFYSSDFLGSLQDNHWQLNQHKLISCSVSLHRIAADNFLAHNFIFDNEPITYLLATGTRCNNLIEYLEGCELSGAEHLRHPWLIHLYAQQTVFNFVQQGLLYAELRAAVSGYENNAINFSFQDACACMQEAFKNAMEVVKLKYQLMDDKDQNRPMKGEINNFWLWGDEGVFNLESMTPSFPIKVGLTLTGKRHKPIRQLLREASAAIVFQRRDEGKIITAHEFVEDGLTTCNFVGFDLAGPEEGFPPELFSTEFDQISRLHIPITIHSGENSPSSFIENAVIDLGAKRIGHGLTLAEDQALMNRLREDRVCIELCPCSNFQTNHLVPHGAPHGREYPLRKYLENGNAICINTDNPIISGTNIIKEYFQASYAYGGDGITLWNLLRIIRMGFIHSFMNVPDRRAMLELADQILFDLFMDEVNVERLRIINIKQE